MDNKETYYPFLYSIKNKECYMYKGSEWGRWDLHIHTKGTAKNDQFKSETMDDFCEILFRKAIENNIKVIGITDYFSISNYKYAKRYQNSIDKEKNFKINEREKIKSILLIPNIELRMLPSTDKGGLINIHILLNPDSIDIFENEWAHNLTFEYSSKSYKMTEYSLIELGKNINNGKYEQDDINLKTGIENFVLAPDTINKALKTEGFRKNTIIVISNSNKDGASAFQKHEQNQHESGGSLNAVRSSIYQLSDAVFSSSPQDREFFLAKSKNITLSKYMNIYGSLKPCIHGSDAHTEDKLFEPDQQRYCWIKAEPTFEGLKQILHEPESRVYIGATPPDLKNDYEVIDHIEIDNDDVFNNKIYFNQNLTTIIGGRSSGKSTLLQCLAKKLNKPLTANKNEDDKYPHIKKLSENLQIFWKDGKEDYSRRIEYFYQGHMYEKSTNKEIKDIIRDILLQKSPGIFDKYDTSISNIKRNSSTHLTDYFRSKEKIKELKDSLEKYGHINDIQYQIDKLNNELNKLNLSKLNDEDMEYYHAQNSIYLENYEKSDAIGNIVRNLDNINIADIFSFEIKPNAPSYKEIPWILSDIQSKIQKYIVDEITESKNIYRSRLTDEIDKLYKLNNQIEKDPKFIKVKSSLDKSLSAIPIIKQLEQEQVKKVAIEKINDQIKVLEKLIGEKYENIKTNWSLMFHELYDLVKSTNQVLFNEKQLRVETSPEFKKIDFRDFIEGFIDQRASMAQNLILEINSIEDENNLYDFFERVKLELLNENIKLRKGFSVEEFTTKFFRDSWFELKYDIIYDGDSYNNMSQGKKAFIVLKLNLECSDSKCPIIIDQPEDDLDNRAIYSELVSYLKKKKSERQIILITHNPNVVINADSELVIVANQHGSESPNQQNKKFEYISGSIESSKVDKDSNVTLTKKTIREHICEILEGGEQAFKLRERKYSF